MKSSLYIFLILLLSSIFLPIYGQENAVIAERTPEQEATRQTEKLQQELNLTDAQCRQVYEINLRYERQRQVSNSRNEAMERIKNKNADLQKVLSEDQNNQLQNKRYERSSVQVPPSMRLQQNYNSSGFRSSTEYRTRPADRVITIDNNNRNNFRTSSPTQQRNQAPQTVRSAVPPNQSSPQIQLNAPTTRSAVPSSNTPVRTESSPATRSSSTNNNTSRTPSTSNTNRR